MDPFWTECRMLGPAEPADGEKEERLQEYRHWLEARIREGMRIVLETVLEEELAAHLGAEPGERSGSRQGYRNGHYHRQLRTRVGEVNLRVPRDRDGSFEPGVFNRYRRMERPLEETLWKAYLEGISTRRVGQITEALGGSGMSASTVSRLHGRLSERIETWRSRPLTGEYPYLYLDGIALKMRWGGHSEGMSVLVALAVTEEGHREVVGVIAGYRESEESWRELLRDLTERGLGGVRLVISDAGSGLLAALEDFFPAAPWQRCMVHVMRNVLNRVPRARKAEVAEALKGIWAQKNAEAARRKAAEMIQHYERVLPKAMKILGDALDATLTYYAFPKEHWKKLRTNNVLERLLKEVRRRTKVAEQFPGESSVLSLTTARLHRVHEQWQGRRYLDMTPLYDMEYEQNRQAKIA